MQQTYQKEKFARGFPLKSYRKSDYPKTGRLAIFSKNGKDHSATTSKNLCREESRTSKLGVNIIFAPIKSMIVQHATILMSNNSDKRITQESLDLYRNDWKIKVDGINDRLLMWAAIYNGEVVGMTACVVRVGKTTKSVT